VTEGAKVRPSAVAIHGDGHLLARRPWAARGAIHGVGTLEQTKQTDMSVPYLDVTRQDRCFDEELDTSVTRTPG
jgi:hypothetical protein